MTFRVLEEGNVSNDGASVIELKERCSVSKPKSSFLIFEEYFKKKKKKFKKGIRPVRNDSTWPDRDPDQEVHSEAEEENWKNFIQF